MVNIDISKKDEELVIKLVNEIIDSSEPNVSGLEFNNQNYFKSLDRLYVLGEILKISRLKENNSQKRGFIRDTILRYKNYKNKNYSYFKRGLKSTINNYFDKKPIQYKILFPMNINYEWIRELEINKFNNTLMEIHSYDYVKKNYFEKNKEKLEKQYNLLKQMNQKFSYFIIIVYDRGTNSAFKQADSTIELFRGLLNLEEKAGRVTLQFGTSQGNPFSKYGPAKDMIVFDSKNKYIARYFRTVHEKHEKIASPFKKDWSAKIDRFEEFINLFVSYQRSKFKIFIERMCLACS
jgi:hypothetical protein